MTRDDVIDVLAVVRIKFPSSDLGDPREAVAGWLDELAAFSREQVEQAVRRLAGRDFAPNAAQVAQEVRRELQGPAPSFDELQRYLARNVRLLPYGQPNTPTDTLEALERLADAGAHEAVLRFVAAHGVFAVRMMPDPALEALGKNESADRRDLARDYRQRVLPAWEADPRPGLALERARVALGLRESKALRPAAALVEADHPWFDEGREA